MPNHNAIAPLLQPSRDEDDDDETTSSQRTSSPDGFLCYLRRLRGGCQGALASRAKHFVVMGIVALDVFALLANVFIRLIACETHQDNEPWVKSLIEGLEITSLSFSSLFLLELLACLFAFGFGCVVPTVSYLASWFHFLDSVVILAGFAIDVFAKGITESIGSLIVVFRLWRLAKISEEVVMGASERIDLLEEQMEELKDENNRLRSQLSS